MYSVCNDWCDILENGIGEDNDDYCDYGKSLFKKIAKYYGWELKDYD
jgi:hypothetical protein